MNNRTKNDPRFAPKRPTELTSQNISHSRGYTWLLQNYFQLAYHLCYVPFKLEMNLQTGRFNIRHSKCQMIICGISSCAYIIYSGFYHLLKAWDLLSKERGGVFHVKLYFDTFDFIIYSFLIGSVTWVLWRKQSGISAMMNKLQVTKPFLNCEQLNGTSGFSNKTKGTILKFLICFLLIILCSLGLILISEEVHLPHTSTWLNLTIQRAKKKLYLSKDKFRVDHVSSTDYLLIALYLATTMNAYMRDIFAEFCLICGCWTLWLLCRDYERSLHYATAKLTQKQQMSHSEWLDIYKGYKRLKRVSHRVNKLYGIPFLIYVLSVTTFLPTKFDELFISGKYSFFRIYMLIFLSLEVSGLLIAAELCAKIQSLNKLICRADLPFKLPRRQVLIITQEADHYQHVSMRGAGVFQLTYGLLGKMMGIMIVYFLDIAESDAKKATG